MEAAAETRLIIRLIFSWGMENIHAVGDQSFHNRYGRGQSSKQNHQEKQVPEYPGCPHSFKNLGSETNIRLGLKPYPVPKKTNTEGMIINPAKKQLSYQKFRFGLRNGLNQFLFYIGAICNHNAHRYAEGENSWLMASKKNFQETSGSQAFKIWNQIDCQPVQTSANHSVSAFVESVSENIPIPMTIRSRPGITILEKRSIPFQLPGIQSTLLKKEKSAWIRWGSFWRNKRSKISVSSGSLSVSAEKGNQIF